MKFKQMSMHLRAYAMARDMLFALKLLLDIFVSFGKKILLTLVNNAHTADKHVTQFGGKIGHRILIHC